MRGEGRSDADASLQAAMFTTCMPCIIKETLCCYSLLTSELHSSATGDWSRIEGELWVSEFATCPSAHASLMQYTAGVKFGTVYWHTYPTACQCESGSVFVLPLCVVGQISLSSGKTRMHGVAIKPNSQRRHSASALKRPGYYSEMHTLSMMPTLSEGEKKVVNLRSNFQHGNCGEQMQTKQTCMFLHV